MTILKLPSRSLRNVRSSQTEKTFTFFVGEESHSCHWFIAEFLSPLISQLRQMDSSVESYSVQSENCSEIIEQFLSIGYGEEVELSQSTRGPFFSLCKELGNEDFCFQILENVELTCENVLNLLKLKRVAGCDFSAEIEFAASHFDEFSQNDIEGLDTTDLSNILSSTALRVKSEDFVFEIVKNFVHEGEENFWLFEHVRFEYLSVDSISSFVELSENHISSLNLSVWRAICARLIQSQSKQGQSGRVRDYPVEIAFRSDAPLDGIISYLARKHGGNVGDVGVVNVTASSEYHSGYPARNAADMTDTCCFGTENCADGWLCYDFKDSRIEPTHYSIRSWHKDWTTGVELVSWVIEISNDGKTWTEVDRHNNDRTFLQGGIGSFAISKSCDPSRFVRLRQIGKTANGTFDYLVVTSFELFGYLSEKSQ
jgi:hypothetical protein